MINIVLGSLVVPWAVVVFLLVGFIFAGAAGRFPAIWRAARPRVFTGIFLRRSDSLLFLGVLTLLLWRSATSWPELGVLNRRNWARILSLVLGGFTAVGGLPYSLVRRIFQLIGGCKISPGKNGEIFVNLFMVVLANRLRDHGVRDPFEFPFRFQNSLLWPCSSSI